MKILMSIHEKFLENSGSAGSTYRLGQEYKKMGHEVSFFSMDDLPSYLSPYLARILFPEYVAAHIAKLVGQSGLDVVDCSLGDGWAWTKIARLQRWSKPLVVSRSHGLNHLEHLWSLEEARQGRLHLSRIYPLYRGSIQLWEVASSLKDADLAFLLNQKEATYAIENLRVDPHKVCLVANGIPESFIGLPFASRSNGADQTIRIAQVGTYIQRKGIEYSAPALRNILKRFPNVEVSFLGIGFPELEKPETVVYSDFEPELHSRIRVVPFYEHATLPELLKGHQIKLFPTLSEGFGKALVEAMACGLVPITTNTDGPMEIVKDGHDALVIPMRDSNAIERAIESLLLDVHKLDTLRKNAYQTAQTYSWTEIAKHRLEMYERKIASKTDSLLNAVTT